MIHKDKGVAVSSATYTTMASGLHQFLSVNLQSLWKFVLNFYIIRVLFINNVRFQLIK